MSREPLLAVTLEAPFQINIYREIEPTGEWPVIAAECSECGYTSRGEAAVMTVYRHACPNPRVLHSPDGSERPEAPQSRDAPEGTHP